MLVCISVHTRLRLPPAAAHSRPRACASAAAHVGKSCVKAPRQHIQAMRPCFLHVRCGRGHCLAAPCRNADTTDTAHASHITRAAHTSPLLPAGKDKPSTDLHKSGAYALVEVQLDDVPKIDTPEQVFTPTMEVKLSVYIRALRNEAFEFKQVPSVGRPGHLEVPGTGVAIEEALALENFPLDVQRLHVNCEFELDESTLGSRFGSEELAAYKEEVMAYLYQVQFYDTSKAGVLRGAGEWNCNRTEIYARPCVGRGDRLSVRLVFVVQRRPWFYVLNIVLPACCIVSLSFISLRFPPEDISRKLSITLLVVLTLVAFRLAVYSSKYLPMTSRMTLMDWFLISAFVTVALVAVQNYLVFELPDVPRWVSVPQMLPQAL
eukprot:365199-Chlamydomonas_euryale.AAC.12